MAVGFTSFPGSLDTHETLLRLGLGTETHLLQPITAAMTSLVVADPSRLSAPSGILLVGNEYVTYTAATGNVLSGLARGQFQDDGGYPASPHNDGERVIQLMTPIHHRVLADALIAVETYLSSGITLESLADTNWDDNDLTDGMSIFWNDASSRWIAYIPYFGDEANTGALWSATAGQVPASDGAGNWTPVSAGGIAGFNEAVDDRVGALLQDSTTIDATYNDSGNTASLAVIANSSTQRIEHRKNSTGGAISTRKRTNWIEGAGIGITVADDSPNDETDITIAATTGVPTGALTMWAGAGGSPPSGWLLCNGQAVSRTTFAALFSAIGASYGAGDGSTTFNVPDFRSRVPFGLDAGQAANDALGETGGARTVTLTSAQSGVPAHSHGDGTLSAASGGSHSHTQYTFTRQNNTQAGGGGDRLVDTSGASGGDPTSNHAGHVHDVTGATANNTAADAASAHENMPPFLTVNFIIKT